MGSHGRHLLLLPLLVAVASAALQDQPQALLPGYGKDFRPFVNYNGIPIAPRPSPWIRAAEIQRADADVLGGERPRPGPAFAEQQPPPVFLQRTGPQFPLFNADGAIYQRPAPLLPAPYSGGNSGGQAPQAYEHSMLLIDHPPEQMAPQPPQPQQQPDYRGGNSGGQAPQAYEHSMLLIDHPPEQMAPQPPQPQQQPDYRNGDQEPQTEEQSMVMIEQQPAQVMPQQGQPDQQPIGRSDDSAAVEYEHSTLLLDNPPGEAAQQQTAANSGDAMSAGGPPEESVQGQQPPADLQTSAQESGVAAAQVPQQDTSVPVFMPYQQGPRPLGVIFQSNEPYPGLSPPPAYQLEQVSWGVQPMQVPVYPNPYREQPPQPQQPVAPAVLENQQPAAYYPEDFQVKGGYQPFLNQRQPYDAPRGSFGARPYAEDSSGMMPRPPGGVAPFPMPSSYLPQTPLEETKQDEVVPEKREESESHEGEKSKDESSEEDDDEASDEIESKVKALKDAVDVEEEVVPALVVFLRKKGHKAFHDKDSVGIPGKEDRFRRSPGIGSGSGSSSHSSSSSSSSSGPVYFGDGGSGSYSSSSSQSSASSSSGGGAPLGLGASGPGLGGSNSFYGGGHVPPSGFGVSGGGGYGNNGYGNTGYGNTGYGNAGYGNTGYGGGVGGGGGGGYGGGYGGVGPSGGGCATCDDSNVLLNRFGEVEGGSGPFTVGGSGASKGQGVHSSASSSIDSTGKVTYTAFAGKH